MGVMHRLLGVASALIVASSLLATGALAEPSVQSVWLKANARAFDTGNAAIPARLREQLKEARVILLGEIHGLSHGQDVDLSLLKALHQGAGVRWYLGEFDAAQAAAFNAFLDSGDRAALDRVFTHWRSRGFQWGNEDFRRKIEAIALWNRKLPASRRIRFLGADEIQDQDAFCQWLGARIRLDHAMPALKSLAVALNEPASCGTAARLAGAALGEAVGQDPVTRDAIAALAINAEQSDREARIEANVRRYIGSKRGRLYGLWGLGHVVQAEVNGTEPLALRLLRSGVPVRSLAILNLDGAMMIPVPAADGGITYGTMRYTLNDPSVAVVNGIEVFARLATNPLTLFTLTGSTSPFLNSDALTRVGGEMGKMQPFVIDPATAPRGFWIDAIVLSRGSPATTPLR